jgi:mannose-6-phosphate isomerase
MGLIPILLQGSLHETIWGGQHLKHVAGKALPADVLVGESWETALDSVALNDPHTGQTLGALSDQLGVRLYGTRAREVCGDRFPLLAKFIDAHAWLSVQVHPDDAYAAAHENGKLGKTEAWRILSTIPDATIMHGFTRATTRDEVERAIRDVRLEELVERVPVAAGDVVFNLAGTLHATGAGIVLYEIQEYSDVTYRLYDFGRLGPDGKGRDLHIERGLDVLDYNQLPRHLAQPVVLAAANDMQPEMQLLVVCRHFALAETAFAAGQTLPQATDGTSCHIISVIAGNVLLTLDDDSPGILLPLGQTAVVPAEPCGYHLTAPDDTPARVLISWVPAADDPRVSTWQAAQEVAGGDGRLHDLVYPDLHL